MLLLLCCSGLIGWFALESGRRDVLDVAGQLRAEVLARVEDQLRAYLSVPHDINAANALALRTGLLDIGDPTNRRRYFYSVVATHQSIAYSFFGAPDGVFFGARRAPDGSIDLIQAGPDTGQASVYHRASPLGDPLEFRTAYPNFDPRTRPWYLTGQAAGRPTWSPVYRHFVLKDLTLTATLPVYDDAGGLLGVFGVDYSLDNLDRALKTFRIGPSGEVFLMERSGLLLATLSGGKADVLAGSDDAFERLSALDSALPRVRAGAHLLAGLPGALAGIDGERSLQFSLDGERQYLQATPLRDEMGVDWLLVAVAAEKDFLGALEADTRRAAGLIALALLATVLAGLVIATRLTRPVARMAAAADSLARGHWDVDIAAPPTRELAGLGLALRSMARQLKESFARLTEQNAVIASHNRSLEEAVQKRTAELAHLHERLRGMFEAIPGFIHVIDKDFVLVDIGDKLLAALGRTREEVLGRSCHEVFHGLERICGHCPLATDAGRDQVTVRPSRPEEEALLGCAFMAYSAPIRDADGEVWGYIECLMDISALRAAEQELLAAKDQALDAVRAKSEFLAKMSHEIRTPMNAMLNMTLFTLDTALTDQQREWLTSAKLAALHLKALIDDVLDYSRIEAGRLELSPEAFDLPLLLTSLGTVYAGMARRKGLEFHLRVDPVLPRAALGDARRLRQVLENLLSNALKFTERGSLSLSASLDPHPATEDVARQERQFTLRVCVEDTGIGIPEDLTTAVFGLFEQADSSISRRFGGTGLGLAISRELAQRMGGDIAVVSALGRGSTFCFTAMLERADPAALDDAQPRGLPAQATRTLDILVVEDNPDNRMVALAMLGKLGHRATAVPGGREALELLGARGFDIVLMDLEMPGMDGFETTLRIRGGEGGEAAGDMPVVAMTAHALEDYREKCLDGGMDDFLAKPVDFSALSRLLAGYAPRPGAGEKAPAPGGQGGSGFGAGFATQAGPNAASVTASAPGATGSPPVSQAGPGPGPGSVAVQGRRAGAAQGPDAGLFSGQAPAPGPAGEREPLPVLDARTARLRLEEESLYQEVTRSLLGSLPERRDRLRRLLREGLREELGREAHTLKGLLGTSGAMRAARAAWRVESLALSGTNDALAVLLESLEVELGEAAQALAMALALGPDQEPTP